MGQLWCRHNLRWLLAMTAAACTATPTDPPRSFADGRDAATDGPADGAAGAGATAGAGQGGQAGATGPAGSAGASANGGGGTAGAAGAGGTGGGAGAGGSAGGAAGSGGMDPLLGLPDTSGDVCEVGSFCYGNPYLGCRIASPTEGRCESCLLGVLCGVQGTSCAESDECGTLYQCYDGACASICELGVGDALCDAADCRDVGHGTHGVCVP